MRIEPDGFWRATRTVNGPATLHVQQVGEQVFARAWGTGAECALEDVPALVGAGDDDRGFEPMHPLLAELHRRFRGLRITRTQAVLEALVPTICEQKVTGVEARRSWLSLVRATGEPAPGPGAAAPGPGLLLPPVPEVLAGLPSWAYHRFGLERKRADTIRRAAASAKRLEETTTMTPDAARRRLTAIPGVGPWSAAEVALVALGDPDAVSLGDWHRPHQVSWALAGEPRGDDDRMLQLLEPYRGQRGRVLRLLSAGHVWAPRLGPRMPIRSIQVI
jgi:3-methyladenine DNA glycosylase/8-oxoguanine DNA glycosylase